MTETPNPPTDDQTIDEVLADEPQNGPSISEDGERASALDPQRANMLAARRRPTVVVLAGAVGSGKTSIYAAIYERLGKGPFAGWMFAGSQTIPGLEQRCHWWRIESERNEPRMEHTRSESLPWLHIRIRDVERKSSANDLLMGDFDGEVFQDVLHGRAKAEDLKYLRRADHVGVVIDGARVADPTGRANERQQTQYLLDGLLAPGALASPRALSLIISKMDLVEDLKASERSDVEVWLEDLNRFANARTGLSVPLMRLAVRSESSRFPLGHGLETFLGVLFLRPALKIGQEAEAYQSVTSIGRFSA